MLTMRVCTAMFLARDSQIAMSSLLMDEVGRQRVNACLVAVLTLLNFNRSCSLFPARGRFIYPV